MMRSLFSSTSGLRGNQSRIDVLGNNIANVNTTGYKSGRSNFRTIILQTLSAASGPSGTTGSINPLQIGLGSSLSSVDSDFNQGTLETTARRADVAIEGNGFFVIGNGDREFFTRNGAFNLDQQGNLVSSMNGFYVKGWNADADTGLVDASGSVESINIPIGGMTIAEDTTLVKYLGNLDAEAEGFAATPATVGQITGNPFSAAAQVFNITPNVGAADTITVPQLARGGAYTADECRLDFNVLSGLLATDTIDVTLTLAGGGTNVVTFTPTAGNYADPATYVDNFVADWNATAGMTIRAVKESDTTVRFYDYSTGLGVPASTGGQGTDSSFAFTANGLGTATANTIAALGMESGVYETFGASASPDPQYLALACADAITTQCLAGNLTAAAHTDGAGTINVESLIAGLDGRLILSDAAGSSAIDAIYGSPSQSVDVATYRTSVVVYDTLGAEHRVNLDFNRRGDSRIWEYRATDENGMNVVPGGATSGTIAFSADGQSQTGTISVEMSLSNGSVSPQTIRLDLSSLSQFAGTSSVSASEQDGVAMGTLENYIIATNGEIVGEFTNGLSKLLGQLSMASFNNAGGLTQIGTSMWKESVASGTAQIGTPESGSRGKTVQGALESSNVDLANEFTQMIIGQRGFQANARVITTSDEMLQELTNLKR